MSTTTYLLICGIAAASALLSACGRPRTTQTWADRAASIAVGTPKAEVERILPPEGPVVDARSTQAGPVGYWVDDQTVVKIRYDDDQKLAAPVVVESKQRP